MERRSALVTAGALTATVSATVSGLFLTVVNTPGLDAPAESAPVVTEYIFENATAAPLATVPAMEVIVAEPTAAGTTGYEDYDEYFENEDDEHEGNEREGDDDD